MIRSRVLQYIAFALLTLFGMSVSANAQTTACTGSLTDTTRNSLVKVTVVEGAVTCTFRTRGGPSGADRGEAVEIVAEAKNRGRDDEFVTAYTFSDEDGGTGLLTANTSTIIGGVVVSADSRGSRRELENQFDGPFTAVVKQILNDGSELVLTVEYSSDGDENIDIISASVEGGGGAGSDTTPPTAMLGELRGPLPDNKFEFDIRFSEELESSTPAAFASFLTCDNCTLSNLSSGNPLIHTVGIQSTLDFSGGDSGTISVKIEAGAIKDKAGNANVAASNTVSYTGAAPAPAPTATIASLAGVPVFPKDATLQIDIILSEASTDFTVEDIETVNATVTLTSSNATFYVATLTPTADGVASIQVKANSFSNAAGTFNTAASNKEMVTADVTLPTVVVSQFGDPVSGTVTAAVTLSEESTNFTAADINVRGGSLVLTGSGTDYQAVVTPDAQRVFISLQVRSNTFSDAAGNANDRPSASISTYFDTVAPTVSIAEFEGPTANGEYTAIITVSEPVFEFAGEEGALPTFTAQDLDVTNGTVTLTGEAVGTSYVATVTPTGGAEIALQVKAGSLADAGGNVNAEASNRVTITTDTTPPIATISPFTGPFNGEFRAAITLSEVSTDFATDDLNVTNGTVVFTGSGTSYQASVTPSADGDLTLQIKAGSFSDAAGNTNADVSNTVTATFDSTPPTATVAAFVGPTDGKYTAAITLSESSLQFFGEGGTAPSFTVDDLMVTNGTVTLTGSGTSFTATVTPTEDGEVTLQVKASSFGDLAGNINTDASNIVTATFDATPPTAVISSELTDLVSGAFTTTITFSEGVTGFGLEDITVSNGAASEFVSTSVAVYTATITPATDGVVTVNVSAAAAQDGAGNPSVAAPQFSITNDSSAPTVSIIVASTEVTGPFSVQFQFSEDVNDLLAETIVISNGTLSDFSGSDAEYSGLVTPTTLGAVGILVPVGASQDAAGNNSEEASLSVNASSGGEAVTVVVASGDNPSDTNGTITLANPGSLSLDFIAFTDQPWLDVTPASGQIPSLGDLEVSFVVNDLILDFPAGTYTANVIVQVDDANLGGPLKPNGTAHATGVSQQLIAEIPVTVELQEQRGDFELIVRTPSGLSNGSSFLLTSDIAAIDGQTVAANAGESRFAISDLLNGSYLIEQPALDGYLIADITCAGDTDNGNIIDVQSGRISIDLDATERQTCIITNSRNDAAIRLATMKAIRGFMERRGDRILSAAPDLSKRFGARERVGAGAFNADANDSRASMSFEGSLSGARNQAKAKAVGDNADLVKPRFDGWDVWTSAEYAKVKDRRDGVGVDSEFFVAQLGADYQVRSNLLVGGLLQYDRMSEDDAVITPDVGALSGARLDGDGFMAGPYAVWKPADNLIVDAMGIFGQSSNTIDPFGYYEDQFETERFLLQTNVTGEFDWSGLRVRPQLGWAHYEDQQEDYIDSLGIEIPSQTVTIGRLRAGPELVWSHRKDDVLLELGSNLRAVWNYEGAGTLDLNTGSLSTGGDPIRVDGGLSASLAFKSGFRVSVETSFDGIGQGDFSARSGRISLSFPFGGAGGSSASQPVKSLIGRQSAAFNGCGGQSSQNGNNSFCSLDRL